MVRKWLYWWCSWMGEITDFVTIYIEESDIFEDEVEKISREWEFNSKDIIGPGNVGYDTGTLHDSIKTEIEFESKTLARITGWYSADHGQYWYRWKGGVDFMSEGLNRIVENYR